MKIKICFVSIGSYPLFNPKCSHRHGGTEVRLYTLAQGLTKDRRFDVNFVTGDYDQDKLEEYGNIKVYKSSNFQSRGVKTSLISYVSNFFYFLTHNYLINLYKFYQTLRLVDADIYIGSCSSILTGIEAFFCKIHKRKHIFMTASRLDVDLSIVNPYYNAKRINKYIYKYGLLKSDLIITQRIDHQTLLKDKQNLKSVVLKNPVRVNNSSKKSKKSYILWVSSSQKLKQPEIYLRVAKAFPGERFVMVMPINDIDVFREIKKEASGIKNLTFIEHTPYHKIDRLFKKAKVFINTSTYEGFPNTFLQAAVNKTPLISLNVNPDNFITEYECGYFADGDPSKMIAQLQGLINNEVKLKEIGDNAFEYVKENHDLNNIITQFKSIIFQEMNLC